MSNRKIIGVTVGTTISPESIRKKLNLTDFVETDPTVPAWAKEATKPTYTANEVGALPNTTKIPSKTSDLTNDSSFATESFVISKINSASLGGGDGSGVDLSAYPTKTEMANAIKDAVEDIELTPGADGKDGVDGTSATHSWNGTVLTVSSASGTSSADLKGEQGNPGKDGYTPIKGVDYFDGKDGKDGSPGKDGVNGVDGNPGADGSPGKDGLTPRIGANNNWFIGDNDTGVCAVGKDGESGQNGNDGYTPVKDVDYFDGKDGKDGSDGKDGKDGADGYTPVKGTDYWTDADKQEMINAVIAALPVYNGEVG